MAQPQQRRHAAGGHVALGHVDLAAVVQVQVVQNGIRRGLGAGELTAHRAQRHLSVLGKAGQLPDRAGARIRHGPAPDEPPVLFRELWEPGEHIVHDLSGVGRLRRVQFVLGLEEVQVAQRHRVALRVFQGGVGPVELIHLRRLTALLPVHPGQVRHGQMDGAALIQQGVPVLPRLLLLRKGAEIRPHGAQRHQIAAGPGLDLGDQRLAVPAGLRAGIPGGIGSAGGDQRLIEPLHLHQLLLIPLGVLRELPAHGGADRVECGEDRVVILGVPAAPVYAAPLTGLELSVQLGQRGAGHLRLALDLRHLLRGLRPVLLPAVREPCQHLPLQLSLVHPAVLRRTGALPPGGQLQHGLIAQHGGRGPLVRRLRAVGRVLPAAPPAAEIIEYAHVTAPPP